MAIIRPRLNDFHNLPFTQEEADFAIPFLDEDLPLYVDPFLLWKSPSLQDNSLHTAITNSFNRLGYLWNNGRQAEATDILIKASECQEVGLGSSAKRKGKRIGKSIAHKTLMLFADVPQLAKLSVGTLKTATCGHFKTSHLLAENSILLLLLSGFICKTVTFSFDGKDLGVFKESV